VTWAADGIGRARSFAPAIVILVCAAACAPVRPADGIVLVPRFSAGTVLIHRSLLELHLASTPSAAPPRLLVLYASGDGGWFGEAIDMFRQLAATGYPVVGFSSRSFLKIDRPAKGLVDTHQLTAEYAQVIAQARQSLALPPSIPVVLSGWSRGAAFAVLTASELRDVDSVAGVIAIGLGAGEDLGIDGPEDETDDAPASIASHRSPFEPYQQLAQLSPIPAAVIQATGDGYLSAVNARQLFGPDTPDRRFYAVEARNHRFSGGKAAFNRSLRDAVAWMTAAAEAGHTP